MLTGGHEYGNHEYIESSPSDFVMDSFRFVRRCSFGYVRVLGYVHLHWTSRFRKLVALCSTYSESDLVAGLEIVFSQFEGRVTQSATISPEYYVNECAVLMTLGGSKIVACFPLRPQGPHPQVGLVQLP